MFIRCRELVRLYPCLALSALGFCMMILPVVFMAGWFLFAWALEEGGPIPLAVETFLVRCLAVVVSRPSQIIGWGVFACGFGLMNVGWLLHCHTRKSSPD